MRRLGTFLVKDRIAFGALLVTVACATAAVAVFVARVFEVTAAVVASKRVVPQTVAPGSYFVNSPSKSPALSRAEFERRAAERARDFERQTGQQLPPQPPAPVFGGPVQQHLVDDESPAASGARYVEIEDGPFWHRGFVREQRGDQALVHCNGRSDLFDKWVSPERLRSPTP